MRKYTHRVVMADGALCSHHGSQAFAEKAVRRYVKMSRGKLTERAFKIERITADSQKHHQ